MQEETDEDGNTTETYVYQLDGQTVDITDALDSIQDLAVTGSDTDATPGTEELSFTFYQDKENFPTVTLVFFPVRQQQLPGDPQRGEPPAGEPDRPAGPGGHPPGSPGRVRAGIHCLQNGHNFHNLSIGFPYSCHNCPVSYDL